MRSLIMFFLCFLLLINQSFAFVQPVTPMQNAVSGVAQAKMQSRGITSADPRYGATLELVGAAVLGSVVQVGTTALIGATFPVWAVALSGLAIGATIAFAFNGDLKWLFKPDGSVQVGDSASVNTPAGLPPPSVIYTFSDAVAGSASAACSGATFSDFTFSGGHGNQHAVLNADGNCHLIRTYIPDTGASSTEDQGSLGAPLKSTNNTTACPGIKLTATAGVCPASNFAEPQAPVKSIPDAAADVPQAERIKPLNPLVVADIADGYWRQAAAAPGYAGLPYDAANPITAADAQTWQQANPESWPTVGDFLTPQTVPSTSGGTSGSTASPVYLPNTPKPVATADPDVQASPSTNPSTEPLQNLGPDPGIGAPSLEPTPTAQMILQPLLNLFPTLSNFVVPGHSAVCPTWSFGLFNRDFALTQHCALFEKIRPTLYAAMALVWVLVALFIVLAA